MRIEHVNLTVSDLDRSVAFYCDLLDLHMRWKGADRRRAARRPRRDDRGYLALFQAAEPGAVHQDHARPGLNHFGFVVDDLDEVRRRLDRLGGTVHFEPNYEPGRRIYFHDPDGHEVEVVEY